MSCDFTVGINRTAFASINLKFLSVQGANVRPIGMIALPHSWKQSQDFPPIFCFQTVQIQSVVVDCGILGNCHAAAVIAAVANGNLKSFNIKTLVVYLDFCSERSR